MAIRNPLSTTNGQIDITSGTGAINIASDAVAKVVTIGNNTGSTALNLTAGTGNLVAASTGAITLDAAGVVELNSSAAAISIGNDAVAQAINIGTGAAARTITIGNLTGATGLVLNAGTGAVAVVSGAAMSFDAVGAVAINSSGAAINIGDDADAFAINIGTGAAARDITIGNTTGATSLTFDVGSGGLNVPSFTTAGALVSTSAGLITDADASTAGYVLTSNGSGSAPSFQAPASGGMSWVNVTGTSQSMAVGTGYVANNASLVTLTLPATAAVGDIIAVQGSGAGGWQIAQNSGQTIHFNAGDSTTGASGYLASGGQYDVVFLMCITANTDWVYNGGFGNYNLV